MILEIYDPKDPIIRYCGGFMKRSEAQKLEDEVNESAFICEIGACMGDEE